METVQKIYKEYKNGFSILYAWFEALHTRIDIILCNKSEDELISVICLIKKELSFLEKIGNRFDPDSEISKINQFASKNAMVTDPVLIKMIKECIDYHYKTQGCFDITVNSYNYTKSFLPFINIDIKQSSIFFENNNIQIDLNGYLKGFALDKIKEIVDSYGIKDALLNFGNSSICGIGNQPNGKGWKIDINLPVEIKQDTEDIILNNSFFTTSGNYSENRIHILSPETSLFIKGLKSVSVITDTGAQGEALSTALFVANNKKREHILRMFPVKSYIFE